MALHLDDIVLRRTDIGSSSLPNDIELDYISRIAAEELNWDESKRIEEIENIKNHYSLLNREI